MKETLQKFTNYIEQCLFMLPENGRGRFLEQNFLIQSLFFIRKIKKQGYGYKPLSCFFVLVFSKGV